MDLTRGRERICRLDEPYSGVFAILGSIEDAVEYSVSIKAKMFDI